MIQRIEKLGTEIKVLKLALEKFTLERSKSVKFIRDNGEETANNFDLKGINNSILYIVGMIEDKQNECRLQRMQD